MLKATKFKKIGALVVAGMAAPATAMAALTADQQAAVDSITTFIADMSTVAWGFVLSVTGVLIAIKLFKKFTRSGT